MRHRIGAVEKNSIAEEMGVEAGDFLVSVGGRPVADVLDYRLAQRAGFLSVEIEKADGEEWELDIEKDDDEDLGLVFEKPLMSDIRLCRNKCVFCFVDQEPKGLRETLYVKDDDWRMSFLHGNYITLTNVSAQEAKRIASLRLSPLRISVHARDPGLRREMMGGMPQPDIFAYIALFGGAGIEMHFQIVLCKGINDGDGLMETIGALAACPGAKSVAVVPAGLTKHREGLYPLEPFSESDARAVVARVSEAQRRFRAGRGSSFAFLSDEFYAVSGEAVPKAGHYEGYPQLANGVGMLRLFRDGFARELRRLRAAGPTANPKARPGRPICIATGVLAEACMRELAGRFRGVFSAEVRVEAVANEFYGGGVTVSGLMAGQDVARQLKGRGFGLIFLPSNAFRAGTETMLDGFTRAGLERELGARVEIGDADGGEFARRLCGAVFEGGFLC